MSPPPVALSRTNLTSERRAFVGRARELAELQQSFAEGARGVVVSGTSGTGKTRLALEFAAEQLASDELAGGVWFVELTDCHSLGAMLARVGAVLGVPLLGGDESAGVERLGAALAAREPLLLLLDNFEQLALHASVVDKWSTAASRVRFLLTSQEQLGLTGGINIRLDPLGLPPAHTTDLEVIRRSDAVRLFVQRATQSRPGYRLGPENAAAVAAIVRGLDGLPLAIELCAARVGVLGETQLLTLLEHRFELLVSDTGELPARHTALRNAIDGSWSLLSAREQRALALSALFSGGFSLAAFAGVVGDVDTEASTLLGASTLLQALADKSLVRTDAPRATPLELRYGLFDSIRAFSAVKLRDFGLEERGAAAHARYFLTEGEAMRRLAHQGGGAEVRRALSLDTENYVSVYERALARDDATVALRALRPLEAVFATHGPWSRQLALLDRALAAPSARRADPRELAHALSVRAPLALRQGRVDAALDDLDAGIALAEAAGDAASLAQLSVDAGQAYGTRGQATRAAQHFERARAVTTPELPDAQRLHALRMNAEALVLAHEGRPRAARARLESALEVAASSEDRRIHAVLLSNIGGRCFELGEIDWARRYYAEAMDLLAQLDDPRSRAVVGAQYSMVLLELGETEHARRTLETAYATLREVGDESWQGLALGFGGHIAFEAGDTERALASYREAATLLGRLKHASLLAQNHAAQAVCEAELDRLVPARSHWARAASELERLGRERELVVCRAQLGHLELAEARRHHAAGDEAGSARSRASAEARLATVQAALHDARTSLEELATDELRFVARGLERALRSRVATPARATSELWLTVGPESLRFSVGDAPEVDLARRGPLRRLLQALVVARHDRPGVAVSRTELIAAIWPDERIQPEAAAARLYVAVSALRKLGLTNLIVTRDDGYLIDHDVHLRAADRNRIT